MRLKKPTKTRRLAIVPYLLKSNRNVLPREPFRA